MMVSPTDEIVKMLKGPSSLYAERWQRNTEGMPDDAKMRWGQRCADRAQPIAEFENALRDVASQLADIAKPLIKFFDAVGRRLPG